MRELFHFLVIYDIRDEKRLRNIAKIMEKYGIRVQKSVFEMHASDKTLKKLRADVSRAIKPEDYVIYFKICEKDWQKREKYGKEIFVLEEREYQIL